MVQSTQISGTRVSMSGMLVVMVWAEYSLFWYWDIRVRAWVSSKDLKFRGGEPTQTNRDD